MQSGNRRKRHTSKSLCAQIGTTDSVILYFLAIMPLLYTVTL